MRVEGLILGRKSRLHSSVARVAWCIGLMYGLLLGHTSRLYSSVAWVGWCARLMEGLLPGRKSRLYSLWGMGRLVRQVDGGTKSWTQVARVGWCTGLMEGPILGRSGMSRLVQLSVRVFPYQPCGMGVFCNPVGSGARHTVLTGGTGVTVFYCGLVIILGSLWFGAIFASKEFWRGTFLPHF